MESLDRVFPGGPGAWLVRHIGTWLVKLLTDESAWKYATSSGGTVSGGRLGYASAAGGEIWLTRGEEVAKLRFLMGGLGLALAPPVLMDFSIPDFPSRGSVRLIPGSTDFATPTELLDPISGAVGPCAALVFDAKVVVGYQAAVMLVGIHDAVLQELRDLDRHVGRVLTLMREDPPDGFWRKAWDFFTRPIRIGYNAMAAFTDISMVLGRMLSMTPASLFRAAIFMEAAELSLGLPTGAGLGIGITAYVGGLSADYAQLP